MKQSKLFIPTLKEVPASAEAKSHQMMLRAGYINQVSAGIYGYLPLAYRVMENIKSIIDDEMAKIDAVPMQMPALIPAELWQKSGRYETYGDTLFKLQNRHDRDFILGPTHEETFTDLVSNQLTSYKKMPLTLYQIQDKFRDEDRPRYGLLRGREFMMQDAYNFSANQADLDKSYEDMRQAYINIFNRCGLDFRAIIADSGAMGGSDSTEFSALAEIGEDTIVYSDNSEYAANLEMATSQPVEGAFNDVRLQMSKINTGDAHTIEELSQKLDISTKQIVKSILFMADDEPVLVLIRGDYQVNDVKLKNYLDASDVQEATPEQVETYLHAPVGCVGPVNVDKEIKVLGDLSIKAIANAVIGANEVDTHYQNANLDTDYQVTALADLRFVVEGETSPDGQGKLKFTRGIEIGHIFKLGTRYSEAFDANFLDENGRNQPILMGCYGIGVSRLLSAICEQQADEKGLVWPKSIAPYNIHVIPVNVKDETQMALSTEICEQLTDNHYDILVDDRKERAGVKFAESDLIGLPIRVTIGKKADEGIVEVKVRKTGDSLEVKKEELLNTIEVLLNSDNK